MKLKANSQHGAEHGAIPASLKTQNTVNLTLKFHTLRVIRAGRDSIYNLGHARNAEADYRPPLSPWQMLDLRFAAQSRLAAWKRFSDIQVELWTDRFRLRSLSSPERLSMSGWGGNLEQRGLSESGESAGGQCSAERTHTLPEVSVITKDTLQPAESKQEDQQKP